MSLEWLFLFIAVSVLSVHSMMANKSVAGEEPIKRVTWYVFLLTYIAMIIIVFSSFLKLAFFSQ